MSPEHTFTVTVYISHFSAYGAVYCPSSYPYDTVKLLEYDPLSWRAENGTIIYKGSSNIRPMCYELLKPLPASTTMAELKKILEEEYKIPGSIQHHFRTDSMQEEKVWLPLAEFNDESTLSQAWEADTSVQEEGRVILVLDTTAKFLLSLSPFQKMTQLRKVWASQKYLRNKVKHEDAGDEAVSEWTVQLETMESLEREYTIGLLDQISTWNRLVYGEEEGRLGFDWLEPKSLEDRMWEVENQLYQWAKRKDGYLRRELGEDYGVPSPSVLTTKPRSVPPGQNWKAQMEDEQVEFHFPVTPEGSEKVVTRAVRDPSGDLDPDSSSFDVESGVLLWGQLHSIFNGSKSEEFMGNAERGPDQLEGGTIRQWPIGPFRCAARNGRWNVRKVFGGYWTTPTIGVNWIYPRESLERHIGWIMVHEDYDPVDIVERCSRISNGGGSSLGNEHIDKDVFFVNRYDWFYRRGSQNRDPELRELIRQSTGATMKERDNPDGLQDFCDAEYLLHRNMQHFCVLDAEEFSPEFVTSYVRDCPQGEEVEKIFSREREYDGTKRKFGTYVSSYSTEYEFAWLVFSGKKHNKFTDEDELIAIVYNSVYDLLEGDRFGVEPEPGQVVRTPGAQGLRWNLPFFQHPEEEDQIKIETQGMVHEL